MSAFKYSRGEHAPVHYTDAEIERFQPRDKAYARCRAPENPPSGLIAGQEYVLYDPGPDDASVGEPMQFVQRAAPAQEPAQRFTFWSWCWCLVRLIGFAALAAAMLAGLEVLAWLVGGA